MLLTDLPDEPLMRSLERRATGRPDATSVRVKWNCLLLARLLDHPSMQSLLRELKRNPTLRRLAGINPALGARTKETLRERRSMATLKWRGQ